MAFINIDGFPDELQIEIVPADTDQHFPKSREQQEEERERESERDRATALRFNLFVVR